MLLRIISLFQTSRRSFFPITITSPEIWASSRSWVEMVYPVLAYFNAVDRGGHFAACEEPEIFVSELRAAFKSLHNGKLTSAK